MPTPRFALPALGLLVLALAGCHTKTPVAASAKPAAMPAAAVTPRPPAPPAPPRMTPPPAPRPLTEDEVFARKSLDALNAEHPLSDAFFDYDQSTLRDDARAALQRDAEWLKRWGSTTVTVQGQCDERGSAEYNLALGERRARAVESYLSSLGVPDARIRVVSLGKEAPTCNEDAESCWSRNRRGHFVITSK